MPTDSINTRYINQSKHPETHRIAIHESSSNARKSSQGESLATLEIKITYLNPGKTGILNCSTKVLHKGRRFAMLESEIMQKGQLIAKASGIYAMYLAKTQTE